MKKSILLMSMFIHSLMTTAQVSVDPGATPGQTGTVTFTYNGQTVTYTTVRAADGNVWLQQNLGSTQVATSASDPASYGHYFQWGRWDDGHQVNTSSSAVASMLPSNDPIGLGAGSSTFYTSFWSGGTNNDSWVGTTVTATNGKDPCAALGTGWHLPTSSEFAALYASTAENITNAASAFASNLKLSNAGFRSSSSSNMVGVGSLGLLWTATASVSTGNAASATYAGGPVTTSYGQNRGSGQACRCMKVAPVSVGCSGVPSTPTILTAAATICSGNSVVLAASSTNTATGMVYQWEQSATGLPGSWSNVIGGTGANTLNYTTATLTAATYFRLVATCSNSSQSAQSASILITVNPLLTPSVSITANAAGTICAGTSVTFTATPVNGGTTPQFQWKKGANVVGTNSATYTDNTLTSSDVISCVLTSSETCLSTSSATSNTLSFTVSNRVTPSVVITASPASNICEGTAVSFTTVEINGGSTPSYQWLNGTTPIGSNSSTISYAPNNGDVISCVLTSSATCATPASVTSNTLTMVVQPLPAQPTITVSGDLLTSSAVNGNQWYKNNAAIPGANNQTYLATESGYYQVTSTENGCTSSRSDSMYVIQTDVKGLSLPYAFIVYPSPFVNKVVIELNASTKTMEAFDVSIVNQMGQVLLTDKFRGNKHELNLEFITPGVYFMTLSGSEGNSVIKIIKQ